MKRVIRTIEKALGQLYNIDLPYNAEDFLLSPEKGSDKSALLVQHGPDGLILGIYFGNEARRDFPDDESVPPEIPHPLSSFSVVAEEISHFHYLIFHAQYGRALTRLELEVQGNVDAFLVAYFAGDKDFDSLYGKYFDSFALQSDLSREEEFRYLEANRIAGDFLKSFRGCFQSEDALRRLREFYRLNLTEKISRTQAA